MRCVINKNTTIMGMGAFWLLTSLVCVPAYALTNRWTGALNNDWFEDGNWSEGTRPVAGQSVLIDTNSSATYTNVLLTNSTPWLDGFVISNRLMTFSNWTTALQATNVTILKDGILTLPAAFTNGQMSNRVYIACSNVILDSGGVINADYRGYAGGYSITNGMGPGGGVAANSRGGGGGHGGKGGQGTNLGSDGGMENDATHAPAIPGSGGGGSAASPYYGGAGGGLVTIQASGGVTINGTVTANGASGSTRAGGGSGGGIYLDCQTFGGSVTGLLSAAGGAGGISSGTDVYDGGAGGGGRIAVKYTDLAAPCAVRFVVERGTTRAGYSFDSWDPRAQQRGTIYFPDLRLLNARVTEAGGVLQGINGEVRVAEGITNWGLNALTVSNAAWVGFADFSVTVTNGLLIQANGALALRGGALSSEGNVTITNGGALHVYADPTNGPGPTYGALVTVGGTTRIASTGWIYSYSDPTNGASPLFQLTELTIAAGGGIDANGKGYIGGFNANGIGPGGGVTVTGKAGGGGHGGKGGRGDIPGTDGGIENDVADAPAFPGSSGGGSGYGTYYGGAGGGLVTIQASGGVTLNGTVTANGASGSTRAGGGSGGGIHIDCQTFGGSATGLLSAAGGAGGISSGTDSYDGGAGGGGRIAVKYTNLAAPCAVRFSAERGTTRAGYSFDSWDLRAQQKGTIYFPDLRLLNARVTEAGGVLQGVNGEVRVAAGITNWGVNTLAISNAAWVGFADFSVTVTNGLSIQANGALALRGGALSSEGHVTIANGGALHVYADPTNEPGPSYGALVAVSGTTRIASNGWIYSYSDPTNGASPRFQLTELIIAAGGGIDANGKGYAAGDKMAGGRGPGGGIWTGSRGSGAGHGGKGGDAQSSVGSGGTANDASNAPAFSGSGGAGGDVYGGGAGGGVVALHASGGVTLDGTVTVNGYSGAARGGGGAGGAIHVVCSAFNGTNGLMVAGGGLGGTGGGGGGGGRIAVWVGVPTSRRIAYLAGEPVSTISVSTNLYADFDGIASVTNGTGYTNLPPGGAVAGTCLFFWNNGTDGTVFVIY